MIHQHSGDIGDLIAALSLLKARGPGELRLYPDPCCGNRMTQERGELLLPFLRFQPYLTSVSWHPERTEGVDLGEWRNYYLNNHNLSDMLHTWQGLPHWPRRMPWLTVDEPKHVSRVVFARTDRWRTPCYRFPWSKVLEQYKQDAMFIGLKEEHQLFCKEVGYVPWYETKSFFDLVRVVAGAELVVANQTSIRWLAEGLKRPVIVELGQNENTHFERPDAWYGKNNSFIPPTLDEVLVAHRS